MVPECRLAVLKKPTIYQPHFLLVWMIALGPMSRLMTRSLCALLGSRQEWSDLYTLCRIAASAFKRPVES